MSDPRVKAIELYAAAAVENPPIEIHRWRNNQTEFAYTEDHSAGVAEPPLPNSFSEQFIAVTGLQYAGTMSREELTARIAIFQSQEA